ncbi:flagellar basal body P-ring formation chaperone FlgA [Photobacterium indicum]|jgi:flagellar basal body P-ring formation protein FlgA|uniref:flagellar basal body P-ring formation chaperone FlgA n=1 Tax=Photobacterium indicum TaxID=81447 RepID=UPI003D13BF4A
MVLIASLIMGGGFLSSTVQAATNHIEQVSEATAKTERAVKRYLKKNVRRYAATLGSQDYKITLQPLSDIPACNTPVSQSLSDPLQPAGRLTITLECQKPTYWKARAKAEVAIYRQLVVAKMTLNRHQEITPKMLSMKRSNVAYLRHGYFTSKQALTGLTSRRKIVAGKIISPRMVELPELVQRNDGVLIEAKFGKMNATMKGVALESGVKGDSIRVRNLSSQKEIYAIIVGPQKVRTNF